MALDTSNMLITQTGDGYYRFVDHSRRLLTMGFLSQDTLMRNANGFADHPMALDVMEYRYEDYLGKETYL